MPDVSIAELQKQSQRLYNVDYPEGMRLTTGRDGDPNGICQALWRKDLNACYDELLGGGSGGAGTGIFTTHALLLPGVAGSYISCPDAAALDILGDIDCRIEVSIMPPSVGNRIYVAKWAAAGQRSYSFSISLFGQWQIETTVAGTTAIANTGTAFVAPGDPYTGGLQFILDVDNGAAGRTATYFRGPDIDGPFTLDDTVTTAGTTSIFASTAPLMIGARDAGGVSNVSALRVTRMELRNSVGTVVANPDFRALATGTTSFADAAGNTWTVQGSARIV